MWHVESVSSPSPNRQGKQRTIRVRVSDGAAGPANAVPLALGLGSWLRHGLLKTWPPERATVVRAEGETIVLTYRDEWLPPASHVLPAWYTTESEWEARFDLSRQVWHLTRLRHLDYGAVGRS